MLPPTVPHDKALIKFMLNDCDFFMEHADGWNWTLLENWWYVLSLIVTSFCYMSLGSFMDHLQFCYDYSTHYFRGHSPRVLLLHSIMGVATNIFPMDVSKEPKLRSMLTDDEMVHVEAFPSVLRCLLNWDLTNDLTSTDTSKLVPSIVDIWLCNFLCFDRYSCLTCLSRNHWRHLRITDVLTIRR